jgi:hypothetical protein
MTEQTLEHKYSHFAFMFVAYELFISCMSWLTPQSRVTENRIVALEVNKYTAF